MVPVPRTARFLTTAPSYTPQLPPTSTSSSMITGSGPMGSRPFVHAAVPAHQYIVFNDYRQRAYGLQHATDLRGGRDVAVLPDLRAASDQGVRIDHGAVVHICAHVDVHGRHAGDAFADVDAIANAGSAGNDAHSALRREVLHWIG